MFLVQRLLVECVFFPALGLSAASDGGGRSSVPARLTGMSDESDRDGAEINPKKCPVNVSD